MTIDNPVFEATTKRMMDLVVEWRRARPEAVLVWHPEGDHIILGALADPDIQATLADSPDAFELLRFLDEKTEHRGDVYGARIAVSYVDDEINRRLAERTTVESPGWDLFAGYATQTLTKTRMADSACPHCGTVMGAASSRDGRRPTPASDGAWCMMVCVCCGGISLMVSETEMRKLTDEEWAAVPAEVRTKLEDAGALFRAAATRAMSKGAKGRVDA